MSFITSTNCKSLFKKVTISFLLIFSFACSDKKAELLESPTPEILEKVSPYVQPAIDFAHQNQQIAFDEGLALTEKEKGIARRLGIKEIDKVRVMYVDEFPFPEDKHLAELANAIGFTSPYMGGFTFGYGIFIKHGNKILLTHELIHVRQYEELGIEGFMKRYMLELMVMGYREAPLEVEAYEGAFKS